MSNKISIDKLGTEIQKYLNEYKEDIEDEVVILSNKYSKEARKELINISPKSKKNVHLKVGGEQQSRGLCWFMVN